MSDEKRNLLDDYEWKLTIEKGGPGSGHWGHAGRPGQRGGSAPGRMGGSGRVNREYFTKGSGRRLLLDLSDKDRELATQREVTAGCGFERFERHGAP